jgi:hypothetical protein
MGQRGAPTQGATGRAIGRPIRSKKTISQAGSFAALGSGELNAAAGDTDAYGAEVRFDPCGQPVVVWTEVSSSGERHGHVWRYQLPAGPPL